MNTIIIALLALSCSIYGAPIYRNDLRLMHETEKFKLIVNTIRVQYTIIYNNIVSAAKEGKHEYQFEIMCSHRMIIGIGCALLPLQGNPFNFKRQSTDIVKMSLAISQKIFTHHLLKKINATFPDSTLTRLNKPCCDYKIAW